MFKKTVLDNGLRVILAPLKETKTITLLVLYKIGSRYEDEKQSGVSHFIEHLMFKGTKKRPDTLTLAKELDKVGAEYNAFTSKDHTGYYIKINHKHIDLAFDVLSDMLHNSKFDANEIEKEKKVIIEEINMYEDNPLMFIEELFEESIYGDTPLGRKISGTKETVEGLSREKIVEFMNSNYQAERTVVGLSGNLPENAIELVKKYFTGHANKAKKEFIAFENKQTKPNVSLKFKETEQVQAALGFPAYSYSDPRIYALYLLGIILGGNMSSRLFIRVREKLGLAYYVRAGANTYEDTGNFIVQAGLDPKRIDEAIKVILEELKKVKDEGVTEEELNRAKEFLDGKITLDLEDSGHVADWYAKQDLLTKEILTPEEKMKKIFAVTAKEVQDVAQDIMKQEKLNLALIGPFKEADKFLPLLLI